MRRLWLTFAMLAVAPLALAIVGCETVDLGNPPSDINSCRPSQSYFIGVVDDAGVSRSIWTDILDKDFGGRKCRDAACHGSSSTNSLRLTIGPSTCLPGDPSGCTIPIPLTQEWEANYRSTAEQMNCSNVMASKLFEYPAGLKTHFGDKLFEPTSPEAEIIIGWVGALP
jgi:hypothetical protein